MVPVAVLNIDRANNNMMPLPSYELSANKAPSANCLKTAVNALGS